MYFLQSAPVCSAELTFVDVDTRETITLGNTDLTVAETNITFTAEQLRMNRHYNITVIAFNVAGTATSRNNISKCMNIIVHDFIVSCHTSIILAYCLAGWICHLSWLY